MVPGAPLYRAAAGRGLCQADRPRDGIVKAAAANPVLPAAITVIFLTIYETALSFFLPLLSWRRLRPITAAQFSAAKRNDPNSQGPFYNGN